MKIGFIKKATAFFVAATVTLGSVITLATAADHPFDDVPNDEWYTSAVMDVYKSGLMEGKQGNIFAPKDKMTRAEIVTVLSRLSGDDVTGKGSALTFKDTVDEMWYSDAVGWAVEAELVKGYSDNTFRPNAPVSRQELAVFLARYLDGEFILLADAAKIEAFSDKDSIATWAKDSVEKIRVGGIIAGDPSGKFKPEDNATRAEIAEMLSRYLVAIGTAETDPMYYKMKNYADYGTFMDGRGFSLVFGQNAPLCIENISLQVLDAFDLDNNIYEVTCDYKALDTYKVDFLSMEPTGSILTPIKIRLCNKITGEVTPEESVVFFTSYDSDVVYPEPFDDPEDFDHGLTDEEYNEMIEQSLYSLGDIARVADVLKRADKGEDITAAYIGGSITYGTSAGEFHCWAKLTTNWMINTYPDANITHVNAGIGGTPSSYGVIRLDRDVLVHDPDIVFVEFAVNDNAGVECQETYESLVRTLLEDDIAVVIVISCSPEKDELPTAAFIKSVGEKYGVPVVDVHTAVRTKINENCFSSSDFAWDTIHPVFWGHKIMGNMSVNLLKTIAEKAETASAEELEVKPIPEDTLTPCRFTHLVFDEYGSHERITNFVTEGWTKNTDSYGWSYDPSAGEGTFEFTFEGKCLTFRYDDTLSLNVSVDGGEVQSAHSLMDGNWSYLFRSDTVSKHTVSITVADGYGSIEALYHN